MRDLAVRESACELLALGMTRRDVSRVLAVGYMSTYRWTDPTASRRQVTSIHCFICEDRTVRDAAGYTYLLGQYLGDGHIAPVGRSTALRVVCDARYPMIIEEVAAAMRGATGASVNLRHLQGCVQVQATTNHWRCLFPQHGPGRKHERPIVLQPWQRELVAADPRALIRGLIHSDGCRFLNPVRRPVAGAVRTYRYPRYLFSNLSTDIQGIFTDALDQVGVPWRRNRYNSVSVARRDAVAALDEFVGPKR